MAPSEVVIKGKNVIYVLELYIQCLRNTDPLLFLKGKAGYLPLI